MTGIPSGPSRLRVMYRAPPIRSSLPSGTAPYARALGLTLVAVGEYTVQLVVRDRHRRAILRHAANLEERLVFHVRASCSTPTPGQRSMT